MHGLAGYDGCSLLNCLAHKGGQWRLQLWLKGNIKAMAEGGIVGRAAVVEIIGCIKFGCGRIIIGTDDTIVEDMKWPLMSIKLAPVAGW